MDPHLASLLVGASCATLAVILCFFPPGGLKDSWTRLAASEERVDALTTAWRAALADRDNWSKRYQGADADLAVKKRDVDALKTQVAALQQSLTTGKAEYDEVATSLKKTQARLDDMVESSEQLHRQLNRLDADLSLARTQREILLSGLARAAGEEFERLAGKLDMTSNRSLHRRFLHTVLSPEGRWGKLFSVGEMKESYTSWFQNLVAEPEWPPQEEPAVIRMNDWQCEASL